jgi:hypothetical protein
MRTYLNHGNEIRTEPEETEINAENLEDKIERVPSGTFGGTRGRLRKAAMFSICKKKRSLQRFGRGPSEASVNAWISTFYK